MALLEVYGLRLRVEGGWPEVADDLRRDFVWFERPDDGEADVTVTIEQRPPDFDRFGDLPATFVTPRNVVYQWGDMTVVDYFGKAISVVDRKSSRLSVQGEDEHLVHEAAYHYMLSRIGVHLERIGLTRLHCLALTGAQGSVAVMLPSGGGKSTLALRALRDDGVRLLSEDSPLLDRRGRLHPFPLRIGVNATDADRLPEGSVRRLERMEFHPKLALDLEAFSDRIDPVSRPLRHLVIGQRSLGTDAKLERASRASAVGPLVREAVVGVGIYQGMEFILQRGMRDTLNMAGVGLTRATCAGAGLARAEVWRASFGRDHEANWAALRTVLG